MTVQTELCERKKDMRQSRRVRMFGLGSSILSTRTFCFNSYEENHDQLTLEEAALFSALIDYFNEN